jgi:flagellar basal body-associated protein FliL
VLHIILAVVAVLFVAAVVVAYLFLVVGDVRKRNGDPLDPDGQRSLDAHEQRDAQRRVNKGARGSGW